MRSRLVLLAALAALGASAFATPSLAADKAGCKAPGWAQQRLPGFDLSDCNERNWATVDIDLGQPQPRIVYGHRTIADFSPADTSKPAPNNAAWRALFMQQAQKAGGKLISDPKNVTYAAFDAKTPKGEFFYVAQHSGDQSTTQAYELTTVAALPQQVQGQGQPMKAALDPLAPCGNPPWLAKGIAHYTPGNCDARLWDSLPVDLANGSQKTLEGPRASVQYTLDDEKNGIPATENQKDFLAIFKQMGAAVVSDPAHYDDIVATQKTPVGEFWYRVQHSGPDDTTQNFTITTVQIMALPQIVKTQAMKAPLDTQSSACADPPWLVSGLPQYKRDSCNNLARDSVTVDLASGNQKAIEGARTAVSYTLTDDKKVETQKALGLSFENAFKAMGATLMSDPTHWNEVVAQQKTPAGEFWFLYGPGGGNDEGAGSYTLTTIQVTAFNQIVKVQPMTAALNTSQKCANPPWLIQQIPQYKLDSCRNFPWDKTTFSVASGDKPLEGSKTVVTYTLTDPKQDQTAMTVKKNYAGAFKAIGDAELTNPDADRFITTQKNAAGEFWFEYDHGSGNSESTGSYSLTTVNVVPFPQVVQVRAMPQGLDTQTKPPCKDPSWLVKQFSYYSISQCSGRDFDSITIDLPGGKKTLAGRILVTDYALSDQTISPTPEYVYKNYANALQGIGTQLVSDPNDHKKAVWTQKTPQGEFWYMYSDSGGNDESEGGYELTSIQVGGPPPKTCTLEVYGVNFDFNKATLRPESEPVLQQVLALFTADPKYAAEIGGHTDNIGTESYNMKLSGARADAVKAWLVTHGVAATRLTTHGYGDTRPLVPNTTDANRFKNRRVELKRQNCK